MRFSSSAGGPKVPEALKQQLAIGGRLVIPVGRDTHQTLLLVRRLGEDQFEQEDHGAVTFVPLIGAEGWVEPDEARRETAIDAESSGFAHGLLMPGQRAKTIRTTLSHLIAEAAEPFGDLDELARLAERFAAQTRGVARRSDPRHGRVLRCPRRDHRVAGREARFQYRGGRSRLARCRSL